MRDVALRLGDGDNHVVPLLAIYLLRRDGPLEMVLLKERKKLLFRKKNVKTPAVISLLICRETLVRKELLKKDGKKKTPDCELVIQMF